MQGFINVFKPSNMSSAKVVSKVKHKFNLNKIGHMGTLDPMACGILPLAIGKATRMFDYFLNKEKTYVAVFKFGTSSNTFDLDGDVVFNTGTIPTEKQVLNAIKKFECTYNQIPPQFSAKVVNGQKAYKLARNGEHVELNPKKITIYKFNLISKVDNDSYKFEISCSSGTYIRSLARDVANNLGTTCVLSYLERIESGTFTKENCVNLEDLLQDDIEKYLLSYNQVFPNFLSLEVGDNNFIKLKNGLSINFNMDNNDGFFITNKGKLLGVATAKNNMIKIKTYLLDD